MWASMDVKWYSFEILQLLNSQFRTLKSSKEHRLWGTTEPTVITDTLLRAAVYSQGPKEEAGRIARVEGIEFSSVGELGLNFQTLSCGTLHAKWFAKKKAYCIPCKYKLLDIFKISNLDAFTNLTRLQLDNNIIEKIENLDGLTNLTWLDLSFNRIEKIENLENLHNLEDISLFNNQIKVIEGLDNLKKLKYLSLGRNLLDDLENPLLDGLLTEVSRTAITHFGGKSIDK
ncbi:leucine Rich repeat-containing domain protein [Opisthorchis viverrini]|uniref:Dynein regulatory complex subunit 3 n=1 Tax=Opisthorchis viverrini TaxID=6198 RepID=A0A1S8X9G8_OPIVI|nr:leucine Rich repeat-containing domain protein [Opisthorchis viverrini]